MGPLSHMLPCKDFKVNAFSLKTWVLSVERHFCCVHTMPEAWSTQSKTLDKALLHELAKNWLMIQESHADIDPARDKDSGGEEKYATELLHHIGKYLYPKITKINDLWLWHRTKNSGITELTMEKNAAGSVNHSTGKKKKETVQNESLWR